MRTLFASAALLFASPLAAAPNPRTTPVDPAGYYVMETVVQGAPSTMAVRIAKNGPEWAATFVLATGESAKPTRLVVDGNQVTMVMLVHGGMELTVDLIFDGDRVSGSWRTESMDGKLSGARAKDPGPGAEA